MLRFFCKNAQVFIVWIFFSIMEEENKPTEQTVESEKTEQKSEEKKQEETTEATAAN